MKITLIRNLFVGFIIFSELIAHGQQTKKLILVDTLSRRAADTIARQSFAKMVTGTEDITSIANYATFVPTDGKFALSANYFFSLKNDTSNHRRPKEFFAVGFTGSGSIVGGNVASLFEHGKLATGTDLGIRLSWRLNKPNIGSKSSETRIMEDMKVALVIEQTRKLDSIKHDIALLPDKLRQKELKISEANKHLMSLIIDTGNIRRDIDTSVSVKNKLMFLDSLVAVKTKIFKDQQKIISLTRDTLILHELSDASMLDKATPWGKRTKRQQYLSNRYGMTPIGISYADTVANKIKKTYEDKIFQVEIARPIQGMRLNWLSVIGNWNRLSYRTYNNTLPFTDAIVKSNLDGYTAGLQMNFYTFYKPVQKSSLLNFALVIKKTSNLEDLTSSKVNDENTLINGPTTRKINKEYTVYTDPVEIYTAWQLPINYYHFYGRDLNFGWHFFALADWRDNGKNVYDVGAGYILGLNNLGSKRLLNIETFVTYKDIKRDLTNDYSESKWKQLQLGLSIAIPFMIFKN